MKKILLFIILLVSLCSCSDFIEHKVEIRRYDDNVKAYYKGKLVEDCYGHVVERYTSRDNKTVVIMYIEDNENYTEMRFPDSFIVIITIGTREYKYIKGPNPYQNKPCPIK